MNKLNNEFLLPDLSGGRLISQEIETEARLLDDTIDLLLPSLPENGPYTEFVIKPIITAFNSHCWELARDHVMSQDLSILIDEP